MYLTASYTATIIQRTANEIWIWSVAGIMTGQKNNDR
jgi:hypothetical protein